MNLLRLRFAPEDEWHGELTAEVSARGFAGRGSAWFAVEELRQFVAALSAFPLEAQALPSITGGFGDRAETLEQVHLAIAFAPHDLRGNVRATIQLATQVWNGDSIDLQAIVKVGFLVTYADLDRFASAFGGHLTGENTEATLRSSVA